MLTFPAFAQQVNRINIVGAERVEPTTIMTYMNLREGDQLSQEALDNALRSLFATGLFADVQVTQSAGTVTVAVKENPIISEIAFEGNDELEDNELMNEIRLRPRQVFTKSRVQEDVARLFQVYQRNGRFAAKIDPKIIQRDQNRVDLVFEISEGAETEIGGVRFVGNKRYGDDALRDVVASKESRWYNFLSSNDRYDADRLSYDEELLRKFYLSQGYVDFRVLSSVAELAPDQKYFFITYTVEEGERYKFGKVDITSGVTEIKPDMIAEERTTETGEWYDADQVQSDLDNMTDILGKQEYAFATVRPQMTRNRDTQTVDLTYRVEPTPKNFVESVNIAGNMRTMDKVVRREVEMVEGDAFNKTKLAKTEQNLRNLDYFEKVEVKPVAGSAPDQTQIDINVEEKSTGEMSIGAGFSTTDGPLADFRIRERNFMGKGQDLQFATTIAGERTEFDVGLTEPYFMDRDLAAGIDLFHMTRDLLDESSYNQRRTGAGLRLGYPLSENWRQTLRYRLERNDIFDIQNGASRYIRDQEGQRVTSAFGQRLTYDTLDNRQFPTEGNSSWIDVEAAGAGGDAQYISTKLGSVQYFPVAENWVFSLMGEVGSISPLGDSDIQINERFFLGGQNFRGFAQAGVGPRDTASDDALGGRKFYRSTAELSFPLGLPEEYGIQGYAFHDMGSVFDLDDGNNPSVATDASLRAAAGVGLSWRSPFGPLRVDLGFPYLKEDYDEEEIFQFNFGTRF